MIHDKDRGTNYRDPNPESGDCSEEVRLFGIAIQVWANNRGLPPVAKRDPETGELLVSEWACEQFATECSEGLVDIEALLDEYAQEYCSLEEVCERFPDTAPPEFRDPEQSQVVEAELVKWW